MTPDYLSALAPSPDTAHSISTHQLIEHMIAVEMAYLAAMGGDVAPYADFEPNMAQLTQSTAQDGVVIPNLVAQLRAHHDDPLLHKGLTSQDVMDTAYAMAFRSLNNIFHGMLEAVETSLSDLQTRCSDHPMMARTRMQAALPSTLGHRFTAWQNGISDLKAQFPECRGRVEVLHLGGAVGDARPWPNPQKIAEAMAQNLNLATTPFIRHALRGHIMDYAHWLTKLTGHLGKIGMDITLMTQQGFQEIRLATGGGSSAMPHKSNPVGAELLVTLGRYCAGLHGTLAQSMIHEQERSGAAWTLEWLVLPQILSSAEASLRIANGLIPQIGKGESGLL